jgi:hypothetical protein
MLLELQLFLKIYFIAFFLKFSSKKIQDGVRSETQWFRPPASGAVGEGKRNSYL